MMAHGAEMNASRANVCKQSQRMQAEPTYAVQEAASQPMSIAKQTW